VPAIEGGGFWIIAPPAILQQIQSDLDDKGVQEISAEVYDALRIEAGLPGGEGEINEEHIPLELGLWDAVSFNKGCYIGQEIIARMESRGKLAKMTVQVELETPCEAGVSLFDTEDKSAGILTSVATIPTTTGDKIIGLAVLKSSYANLNYSLKTKTGILLKVIAFVGTYEATYER
jgi:aminomethyltransferase